MSTAIWGESKSPSEETYPLLLLKQLLQQMMEQFQAVGTCLALYNESSKQMEMQLHLRLRNATPITSSHGTEIAHQPQKQSILEIQTESACPPGRTADTGLGFSSNATVSAPQAGSSRHPDGQASCKESATFGQSV